jgi:dienelactone hydrolase
MTRRFLLRALPAAALPYSLIAQETSGADNRIAYRNYPRCLPDFLRSLAQDAYTRRTEQIRKLKTAQDIRARQEWARRTFWKLAGGMPERTPLNLKITGTFEREKYRVEKLVYESQPGQVISANLYIPKTGAAPYPGVLFQMGHSLNGKAADTYQRCCQGLVQLGFVVLAFDPMGQGERVNYPGPDGVTRFGDADVEHTHPGRQLLLLDDTASRMQVWDAVRSLDVLASSPLVDPRRLASTGQSGGATITMMLAAVDDRVAAAVVSSGNTENVAVANFLPPGAVDDAEQNFIASGPAGFDRWDLLWPFAPRPLLVLTSARDFFGTYSPTYEQSGLAEYALLQEAYRTLGQPERLQRGETPLPHGMSYSLRLETYRWLSRWLKNDAAPVDQEPPVAPESDRTLWAGPTGNVVRDFQSRTPFQIMRERLARIETPRTSPDLKAILNIEIPKEPPALRVLGSVPSRSCRILAVEIPTAPGVWVPAWIFSPLKPIDKLVIAVEHGGRNQRWHEGELWQELAQHAIVCATDVRGIGDLRPEFSPGAPDIARTHQQEESYAWGSLVLGTTMLAQRVVDLVAVTRAVETHFPNVNRTLLAASGPLTVPALCASLLNSKIDRLLLSGHLISWRNIVETELYTHPFENFVPGIISRTDLPQIASAIAPREIVLAGAVDAAGREADPAAVRSAYSSGNVKVRKAEKWSMDIFSQVL